MNELIPFLREAGVLVSGHVRHHNGLHGDTYLDRYALTTRYDVRDVLAAALAIRLYEAYYKQKDVVLVGARIHGTLMADALLRALRAMGWVGRLTYVTRHIAPGGHEWEFHLAPDGAAVMRDNTVIVVDDVITTGQTAGRLIQLARFAGGIPAFVAVVWRRRQETQIADVPVFAAIDGELPIWDARTCPKCRAGEPFVADFTYIE